MQMMSYRTREGAGPAVSEIVETRPGLPRHGPGPVSFSHDGQTLGYAARHTSPRLRPMRWREAPAMAGQMDFGISAILAGLGGLGAALGPMITQAAPVLLNALPSIIGAVGGLAPVAGQVVGALLPQNKGGQAAQRAGQALGGLSDKQLRSDLQATIEALRAAQAAGAAAVPSGGAAAPAPTVPTGVATTSSLARLRARAGARSNQARLKARAMGRPRSRAMIADGGIVSGAVAGQLLGPLLKQVLTPETVQSIIKMPNQHMQTIFSALKDAGKLALQSAEQDLRHLRELNPGVDDPSLDALLASMSIGLSKPDPGRPWKRAPSVALRLLDAKTVALGGQQASVYARDARLAFPLAVDLPSLAGGGYPVIRDALVQIQAKDAETLEVLVNSETPVGEIAEPGRLSVVPALEPAETGALPDGRDVIFCFTLIWTNARGEPRGAPLQHRARIAPALVFDRIEPGAETFELSDRARFGDYWHKFWGGRFRDGAKKYEIEARYLIALSPDDTTVHHRLETLENLKPVEGGIHRMKGALKTGMEVSIPALARLAAVLDPAGQPPSADAVAALRDTAFTEQVNRSGRAAFTFRGSRDEAFELYAWPVMAMDTVVLKRPGDIDPNGQVLSFEDVHIRLPLPRAVAMTGYNLADGTGPDAPRLFEAQAELFQRRLVAQQSRRQRRRRYG